MWGQIAGAVAGSLISAKMSQRSADKQMAFQADMSGTAYKRAMADMKKAGLNPILAGKLGPASTPSGAMANIPDFGQTFNTAYSAQTQRMQTLGNLEKIAADINLTQQQTKKVAQETTNLVEQLRGITQVNDIKEVVARFVKDSGLAEVSGEGGSTIRTIYEYVFDLAKETFSDDPRRLKQAQKFIWDGVQDGVKKGKEMWDWIVPSPGKP